MTRAQASVAVAIAAVAFMTVLGLPEPTPAQQGKQCADHVRQVLAVRLARQINSLEINTRPMAGNRYQPMSAFPQISVPVGFTAQLVTNGTGSEYVFSVKDTQDPCGFSVFSDQEGLIYTAQPLQ